MSRLPRLEHRHDCWRRLGLLAQVLVDGGIPWQRVHLRQADHSILVVEPEVSVGRAIARRSGML